MSLKQLAAMTVAAIALLGAVAATLVCASQPGEPAVPATRPAAVVPADLQAIHPQWTFDHGGVIRGDMSRKKLALIFTGGDFGEGTGQVLDALKDRRIRASFFFTGDYLRKPEHQSFLKRIVDEGHYLGPHSDSHPLYCPWDDRGKTLVTEQFFKVDLQKNINDLRERYGALREAASPLAYFIPPYEWFNDDQVRWARDMGVLLFNFSPGSGSNRDWAPEDHKSFVPSRQIIDDILRYEATKDPHGLNGFLLLLHVGSQRRDKPYLLLGELLDELKRRGYGFVRVDELLRIERV